MQWIAAAIGMTEDTYIVDQERIYKDMEDRGDFKDNVGKYILWYNPEIFAIGNTPAECVTAMRKVYQGKFAFIKQIGDTDKIAAMEKEKDEHESELQNKITKLLDKNG